MSTRARDLTDFILAGLCPPCRRVVGQEVHEQVTAALSVAAMPAQLDPEAHRSHEFLIVPQPGLAGLVDIVDADGEVVVAGLYPATAHALVAKPAVREERSVNVIAIGFFLILIFALGMFFGSKAHADEQGPTPGRVICLGNPPVCRFYEAGQNPPAAVTVDLADRMAWHGAAIGFSFAADMGTTSWALRRCASCFEQGFGADVEARVALHLAFGTAAFGGTWLLERANHRGWARAIGIGTAAIFGGAAVNNTIHAIRRH